MAKSMAVEDANDAEEIRKWERLQRLKQPDFVVNPKIFNLMQDVIKSGAKSITAFHWLRMVTDYDQSGGIVTLHSNQLAGEKIFLFLESYLQIVFKTRRIRTEYVTRAGVVRHVWLQEPVEARSGRNTQIISEIMHKFRSGQVPYEPPYIPEAPWAYCTIEQAEQRDALHAFSEAMRAKEPSDRIGYMRYLIDFCGWPYASLERMFLQAKAEMARAR